MYVCLFLGSLFCSIDLYVCFYADTILFWLSSFVIEFEVREYDASSFILFQGYFGYLGFLWFYTNFRIICYFFEGWHWSFDRDCIESIDCFGWCGHLSSIDSSKPRSTCIFELKKAIKNFILRIIESQCQKWASLTILSSCLTENRRELMPGDKWFYILSHILDKKCIRRLSRAFIIVTIWNDLLRIWFSPVLENTF